MIDSTTTLSQANILSDNEISYPKRDQKQLALKDAVEGITKWRIWFLLAYQDIKLRYRRSVLGPFWITLSMAITVYSMGFLYSHLFHTDMPHYYPFLVAGMLAWSLISTIITDMTETFIMSDSLVKQIKLPYTLHVHRTAARNFLIYFHNIFVIIPIMIIFHNTMPLNFYTLLLIPGLMVIYLNSICYGLILAMIGARYRDMSQLVKSLVQVTFFVTPIMWNPSVLPEAQRYVVNLNPFYAFVELIRAPLLGTSPAFWPLMMALGTTLFGISICSLMLVRYRNRIVYWL